MSTPELYREEILKLAKEWDQDAAADEAYLSTADRIGPDDGPRLDGQIQLARLNAQALRDLVERLS